MRYPDAAAFRHALEARLKPAPETNPARLVRDRKRIVFDRLLVRLVAVAGDQWLLKGGFALDLRMAERARATKDVDIEWREADEALLDALIEAAAYDAGDFFVFGIERSEVPADRLAGGLRFRVSATLAARPFESFPLDVGFRPADEFGAETLITADLLGFAGIPPVEVPAIPLVRQVAEKLHAYTRTYEGGRSSSRAKDLVDLALIAQCATLDAGSLRQGLDTTFSERGAQPVPRRLPTPPAEWTPQFSKLATSIGLSDALASGHRLAASLLDPVLDDEIRAGTWSPDQARWTADRPQADD